MPEARYFQLKTEFHGQPLGVDSLGNLEPLVEEGINLLVPTIVDGELVDSTQRNVIQPAEEILEVWALRARIIPDTRIIESLDPRVDGALIAFGKYEEIEPPTSQQLSVAVKDTQDSRDSAELFDEHGVEKDPQSDSTVAIPTPPPAAAPVPPSPPTWRASNDDENGEA